MNINVCANFVDFVLNLGKKYKHHGNLRFDFLWQYKWTK